MKLISWNVNGIRAVLQKGFLEFVKTHDPDVLCIQETKAHQEQVGLDLPGYGQYWNAAKKKGYAGTALFTKKKPLHVTCDMGIPEHDGEGRVICAEFPTFNLVNVYTPNAQRELTRLDYRQRWDADFRAYLKRLEKKKPVVFCGDLNVAHEEIDLARPKQNVGNAGFTDEERAGFRAHLDAGFVDTFRHFNQEPDWYTWWSYMFNARRKNIGWRIDYFCVSKSFLPRVNDARIHMDVMGSDHCPISITLKNG